ncbi:polycystic kidney disease 1 like 1-like [Dreissena polymorpha]|uniref:polycystic kidney disease 1 like 1-like n=1 Tax=Dreissena polymorpha TaxID=45954 RepID=UPI002264E2BA|nr:polycystic kidney disease 1 like 1-like [Dreissena polymorpha]
MRSPWKQAAGDMLEPRQRLPDSIGKIWKVQIWHNNFGPSPSWYLSRVIVRDLNTGNLYLFLCEKWLAVEEQDGKVEREFMALDGTLDFNKAYMTKVVEYMADFHIWLSLVTCPPYSGFMRCERLTVCLTMLLAYMCLNAMWYRSTVTEVGDLRHHGEFGLLDVSWQSVTVGAICCAVVIPLGRMLEFLFRRSKPKHASNVPAKDAVTDWEPDYPSGKPNEAESEASSEQVLPVMTYSLFDQSILNWPNIQTWAQKQWMKRQQTGRSVQEGGVSGGSEGSGHSHPGNHILGPCSHHGNHILGPGSHHGNHIMGPGNSHHGNNILGPGIPVHPVDLATLNCQDSELDQASSGFEDCHFLLQQKTSADSTHTTAAPSINESLRVHKPQSLPDSLGLLFTKQLSEGGSAKTIKAPSISSNGSNKSVLQDRRKGRLFSELYLPFWCRYIAWSLCAGVCVGGATVTVMYGYTFGTAKSTLWLQSLYFSMMICVFIANPVLIMITVVHAALVYKHDPMSADCHGYEIFNHEKAQEDLKRWKQQLEDWDEGDALERGVAARQRSRYLRFARPPQEKQLIEARKRVMKEKRAIIMFREVVVFLVSMVLLLVIAYGKNNVPSYHLNRAVKSMFIKESMPTSTKGSNPHLAKGSYLNITSPEQWYHWARIDLLSAIDAVPKLPTIFSKSHNSSSYLSLFMIGEMTLRQQRVQETICPEALPYAHASCLSNHGEVKGPFLGNIPNLTYSEGASGNLMIGNYGIYDGSGFVLPLSCNRLAAEDQINTLAQAGWLDRHTRVVFVELTLYNPPTNLFTAVRVTSEFSNMGRITSHVEVTSTQLFRYVTPWDNILLACELLFFVLMMLFVKNLINKLMQDGRGYFFNLWNALNFLICLVSMFYCGSFIYRFVIVADLIERLRSTYYEKHVNVCFVTFWDEMLRSLVGMLVFLCTVRCVRLLRFNAQFARLGDVYRKARRELVIFFGIFCVLLAAYSSLGHQLFGCMSLTFRDLWSSLLGVTALLSGRKIQWQRQNGVLPVGTDMFLLMISTFGTGIMVAYMVAVLSHFLRSRKKRRLFALDMRETLMFYWEQFQLWTGLKKPLIEEEPVIILPPEFTMAEIEYQVDELLFRMNALTGSHGLPEKPPCYLTDSDCTYGAGDDGISSGGSEGGQVFTDDRLEQRVQKIEDNLCSQEPFLAQLLKLDCLFSDDLSQQKEKQLRSHLEMEIFRQLQMQRQDSGKGDHSRTTDKGGNPQPPADTEQGSPGKMKAPHSPGQNSTSSEEMVKLSASANKTVKPRRTRNNFTVKTIQDLLAKSGQEVPEFLHENSSSNPDSPKDKKVFSKSLKPIPAPKPLPHKRQNSTSSSEKVSDASNGNEPEVFKKPTKPTFLHSRESSLSEGPRGSPILKLRTCSGTEKMPKSDGHLTIPPDTSSGSEQDGMQVGKKLLGKRNLRKTKSRGKGKGPDNLEPELVLDELDFEDHQDLLDLEGQQQGKGLGVVVLETVEGGNGADLKPAQMPFNKEHVVTADVHQVYM